jgi:type IV pilus assembly protein PilB
MAVRGKIMGEMLIKRGVISNEQLAAALEEQRDSEDKLGSVLVKRGVLTEQQLRETLEFILGIPQVQISKAEIDPEAVKMLPPEMIRRHRALPIARRKHSLTVAMDDPLNQQSLDDMRIASGLDIVPVLASAKELDLAIRQYLAFQLDPGMERILGELCQDNRNAVLSLKDTDLPKIDNEAPIIRMVNAILMQAVRDRASDVHLEPQAEHIRVRFRIDGELYQILTLPRNSLAAIVSRLKIMAGMDIAEKRIPQDGRFHMQVEQGQVDFRVSSLPTSHGEKIALRILDQSNAPIRIDQLGLSAQNREKLVAMARRPHGIILVTGPTGSGKTTTLYSLLGEINSMDRNLITLEDPIEYSLAGINQVQTNPKAGLTFASGLRSILRQDPDVIMVGEIRDEETARLAVQAALTGHLVFSTLHTNGAAATIARLSDMGIEDFLLATSLTGIVSQRLVRRLCTNCRETYLLDEKAAGRLGIPEQKRQQFFRSHGCNMCRQLGYQGRMALHEIMVLGTETRNLISRGELAEGQLETAAIKAGMRTMKADGIAKARQGLTSLEEVMKAVLWGS